MYAEIYVVKERNVSMMILKEISDFVKRTCVFFTVGILGFVLAGVCFSGDVAVGEDGFSYIYTRLVLFGAVLCFSAFLSLAIAVSSYMRASAIFKVIVNFLITYVGFYVSFFVLQGKFSLLGEFMYVSFVFVIAYAVVCAVVLAVKGFAARMTNENSDYKSVYNELESDVKNERKK